MDDQHNVPLIVRATSAPDPELRVAVVLHAKCLVGVPPSPLPTLRERGTVVGSRDRHRHGGQRGEAAYPGPVACGPAQLMPQPTSSPPRPCTPFLSVSSCLRKCTMWSILWSNPSVPSSSVCVCKLSKSLEGGSGGPRAANTHAPGCRLPHRFMEVWARLRHPPRP